MREKNVFDKVLGKTIAVVYIFEGENAPGFEHYHVWKSDVISEWLKAIQDLKGLPFILDVRTFVEKAMNHTLPHIDYVINLNCGSCNLSPMGLIPSVCGFLSIPCIPCDTTAIISGENKNIANQIAKAIGLNVPETLLPNDKNGIFRPLNYGSSVGVKKGQYSNTTKGVYQRFIPGYDITTPMAYNPYKKDFDILPTIIFLPQNESVDWFYGELENISNSGYTRKIIRNTPLKIQENYKNLAKSLCINTFCRIDARLACPKIPYDCRIEDIQLCADDVFFIEINPMPSIRLTNNEFYMSFSALQEEDEIYQAINSLKEIVGNVTLHNYLLASSMLAFSK